MRKSALAVLTLTAFCLAIAGPAFADVDTTPPNVTKLELSNKIFKIGKKNTLLITKKQKKVPTGTKVLLNTMQRIGKPGPNSIAFSGILDGKKLKTGAHGFGILATDEAGNSSPIVTRSFLVIKGKRAAA